MASPKKTETESPEPNPAVGGFLPKALDLADKFDAQIVGADNTSITLIRKGQVISVTLTDGYERAEAILKAHYGV